MTFNHHSQPLLLLLIVILDCKWTNVDAWWTAFNHHQSHHHYRIETNSRYFPLIINGGSDRGRGAPKQRSFNQIHKIIVGNPFIHPKNIHAKTAIYPRTPVWNFKKDALP